MPAASRSPLWSLRIPPPRMTRRLVGVAALGAIVLGWWFATSGLGSEDRLISPVILPSPGEVIRSFPVLLNERALLQSIAATLRRVLLGFGLAALIGVPLGIVAGSWRVIEAAGAPLALFGRNLPIADQHKILGRNAADVAIRLLRGAPARSFNVPPQSPGRPTFDWRELQRWNISENRLPPDSVLQFIREGSGPLVPGEMALLGEFDSEREGLGLPRLREHRAILVSPQRRQTRDCVSNWRCHPRHRD